MRSRHVGPAYAPYAPYAPFAPYAHIAGGGGDLAYSRSTNHRTTSTNRPPRVVASFAPVLGLRPVDVEVQAMDSVIPLDNAPSGLEE